MVTVLLWLAALLLLLVVVPLASALRFRVAASERGAAFELRWLLVTVGVDTRAHEFRLALLSLTILRRDTTGSGEDKEKPKKDRKPRKRRPRRRFSPAGLLSERRAMVGLVRYLWRQLRWQRFRLRLTVATPDPALTGELFGYLSAAVGTLAAYVPAGSLQVSPDFVAEWPGAEVDAAVSIRVFALVVLAWRAFRIRQRLMRPV